MNNDIKDKIYDSIKSLTHEQIALIIYEILMRNPKKDNDQEGGEEAKIILIGIPLIILAGYLLFIGITWLNYLVKTYCLPW